jgi:tetratricopeptide (TPR) repeat protein
MNDLLVFIALFIVSLWLLVKPVVVENQNGNIMQGQLRRLWQDAHQNLVQNNTSRAERSLLALLKLDGRNFGAYNRLGIIYARQGLKKEAIECFEISSSINTTATSLYNLALVYYQEGEYEKAARTFEHAIEKDPENPSRHIALAKTLERMGEPKAAIKELEKAHKLKPGSEGSTMLANAYKQIGAPDLAEEVEKESKLLKGLKA